MRKQTLSIGAGVLGLFLSLADTAYRSATSYGDAYTSEIGNKRRFSLYDVLDPLLALGSGILIAASLENHDRRYKK